MLDGIYRGRPQAFEDGDRIRRLADRLRENDGWPEIRRNSEWYKEALREFTWAYHYPGRVAYSIDEVWVDAEFPPLEINEELL